MANRVVTSIVTHSIILLIATIAAYASVGAAETVWNILVETLAMLSPPPFLERITGMIMLMLCVLLPVIFILGAAFVVTFFSLTLLGRPIIVGQKSTTTRLDVIGVRLAVASAYAALSLSILIGCVLAWRFYGTTAIRSPAPYPGAVVTEQTLPNLGGFEGFPENDTTTIVYEYSLELPLNEAEQYYATEMEKHCMAGWGFTDTASSSHARGRKAECEISHPLVRLVRDVKHFVVVLRSVSETETNVSYSERKRDPMGGWFPDFFAVGNDSSASRPKGIGD